MSSKIKSGIEKRRLKGIELLKKAGTNVKRIKTCCCIINIIQHIL